MAAVFAVLACFTRVIAVTRRERGIGSDSDDERHRQEQEPQVFAHQMTSGWIGRSVSRNQDFSWEFAESEGSEGLVFAGSKLSPVMRDTDL